MGYPRLTFEEKEDIKNKIRSGMTNIQIHDVTGRSIPTIQGLRNELRVNENFDNYHKGSKIAWSIPCPVIDEKKTEDAPKQMKNLQITKKVIRFAGVLTAFEYIVGSNSDVLIVRDKGQEFQIEFEILENFIEELMDLVASMDDIKKLVL